MVNSTVQTSLTVPTSDERLTLLRLSERLPRQERNISRDLGICLGDTRRFSRQSQTAQAWTWLCRQGGTVRAFDQPNYHSISTILPLPCASSSFAFRLWFAPHLLSLHPICYSLEFLLPSHNRSLPSSVVALSKSPRTLAASILCLRVPPGSDHLSCLSRLCFDLGRRLS